jgi:polysaccharide pyruvyl transferase CsaB
MADTALRAYRAALRKRYGAALCGAYGMGNVGDEAILTAILAEIREVDADVPVWVFSRRPKQTAGAHRVRSVHTFNVFSFFRVMGKVSVYMNGGGNLIQDDTSRRSLWFYLYTLAAAKMRGARVIMYGCGIGPVNYAFDRWAAGGIINSCAGVITLREEGSADELRRLGVTKPEIRVSADPVLSLASAGADAVRSEMAAQGLDPSARYVCFALRPWRGVDEKLSAFAAAAAYARSRYGLTPVFFPVDGVKDDGINRAAAELCGGLAMREIGDPGLAIGVLGGMALIISMRLHGLIFAAGRGVPLIGVSYEPKVSRFMRSLGEDNCVELDGATERSLTDAIDRALTASPVSTDVLLERERVNRDALRRIFQ